MRRSRSWNRVARGGGEIDRAVDGGRGRTVCAAAGEPVTKATCAAMPLLVCSGGAHSDADNAAVDRLVDRTARRPMLIRRAVLLDGTETDIRVGERIIEVADRPDARRGEAVYDAAGGTVIPGLHDHHVHLRSAAAALHSVRVGPDEVRRPPRPRARPGRCRRRQRRVDPRRRLPRRRRPARWIAHALDEAVPADSGARAAPQRRAVDAELGRAEHASASPITPTVGCAAPTRSWSATLLRSEPGLAEVSARLSRYGVTGVTDATPDLGCRGRREPRGTLTAAANCGNRFTAWRPASASCTTTTSTSTT